MSQRDPTAARHATGTSDASLDRALRDQAVLARGRMNATDEETRYTPSGLSKTHYDTLRWERNDLDYREWNEDAGFSGVNRWPTGPGMDGKGARTDSEQRRERRRMAIDDGF